MKFLDWYLKIGVVSALIGASMEFFMIKTGFYDKVTVLESEKRTWESSPEAQAIREALNPWRNRIEMARFLATSLLGVLNKLIKPTSSDLRVAGGFNQCSSALDQPFTIKTWGLDKVENLSLVRRF
uniref:Uncharacterized protein n=1 Tax=Fagus sylvatica TaxID=28930 RepID=A0A2N9EK79_FAGSY